MKRLIKIKSGTAILILTGAWVICLGDALRYNSDALLVWSFIPMAIALGIMITHERPGTRLFRKH